MDKFSRFHNGESVIDIWGDPTALNGIAEPTADDLNSEEFQSFLRLVLMDALGEDFRQVG